MKPAFHCLAVAGAIALGTCLRFVQLDAQPLWLDEVITALLSLGQSEHIPLEQIFPLTQLEQIFTLKPQTSFGEIAQSVATQSTHPPVFFGLMYQWLRLWDTADAPVSLVWQLRALPALFGIGAIAAIYYLTRLGFSAKAGAIAALVAAVSPFSVYLSQQARHYTLPLLLLTLTLSLLLKIAQSLERGRKPPLKFWLSWIAINSLGFYIHYFYILGYLAQVLVLFSLKIKLHRPIIPFSQLCLYSILPFLSFLPWFPIFLGHLNRPETQWMSSPNLLAPFYHTLAGWIISVILLPIAKIPFWAILLNVILMVAFAAWLGWHSWKGFRQLWQHPQTHLSTWILTYYLAGVFLEFLLLTYGLNKDITSTPRYNFVYFPSLCALLGASLFQDYQQSTQSKTRRSLPIQACLSIGILSSLLLSFQISLQQPFQPHRVAQRLLAEPTIPTLNLVAYKNMQDVALGFSIALELYHLNPNAEAYLTFLQRSPTYEQVWQSLAQLTPAPPTPLNLWAIASKLTKSSFPTQVQLSSSAVCHRDPTQYYRITLAYQLYRCP